MCGIAGLINRSPDASPEETIRRMISRIRHRGPDHEAFWNEGRVWFGHCRLAIRDLSPAGNQPFISSDGRIVTVYNGEIYNQDQLLRDLEREIGFQPKTSCDTELIPAAYQCWGTDAFDRLEGIFALALWDRQNETLVLARDAFGTKPLYIWEADGEFGFASEVKALLQAMSARPELSPPDLAHMLALGYPAPDRTLLRNVRQLPPGTVLVRDRAGTREHRYWAPRRKAEPVGLDAAVDEFRALFQTVVDSQLVSDVPVGVMQSGGIDSSLISLSLPPEADVPLFTARFANRAHDESDLAEKLAKRAGRTIEWVDLPEGEDLAADFRRSVDAVDGQLADSSLLATFGLSRALAARTTVALSGDGADEFFGGYPTYRASRLANAISPLLPSSLWAMAARGVHALAGQSAERVSPAETLYRFLAGLSHDHPHALWRHYLAPWKRREFYGPSLQHELAADPFSGYAKSLTSDRDVVDRCLLADQGYYLPADMLVKVDRASMANSLEVRVPFLDRRIAEFAATLPHRLFLGSGSETKLVLRKALAAMGGPDELAHARKRGFNLPVSQLLRTSLAPLAEQFLVRNADIFAPFLVPDAVRKVWRDQQAGRRDEKYLVWTLLTLAVWIESEGIK